MKYFKVIFALLPVLILIPSIYFSVASASIKDNQSSLKFSTKKTSRTVCEVRINLRGSTACMTGNYIYCLNGVSAQSSSSSEFTIYFEECGQYSLCVYTDAGCTGTAEITIPCRVECLPQEIGITLVWTGSQCICN